MKIRRASAVMALSILFALSCAKVENPADVATEADGGTTAGAADGVAAEPAAAVASASVRKPCSFVERADLEAVAGPDAKCEDVSGEQARLGAPNFAEYEMSVNADPARGIAQMKAQEKSLQPLAGVGDEAYINGAETAAYVRKGTRFAVVSSTAVVPGAPKTYKEGVRFLAGRIATKL